MTAKAPQLKLRVLHITTAGRSIVSVVPEGETVTIGTETWKVNRNHILPGKGKFDVAVVSGQSEAVPIWGRSPITAIEVDSIGHDNLLSQIRELAQGGRTNAVNWLQVGLSAVVILALVGVAFKLHGDNADLRKLIENTHVVPTVDAGSDSTKVQAQPQQGGSLGQLQQQQTGGTGPP